MKTSRIIPGAVVAGAVAVASVFAAAPAVAATLPPGQKITVVDSWWDQFYTVNPADGVATPTGAPDDIIYQYLEGIDVDDTGHGYAIANYNGAIDLQSEGAADAKVSAEAELVLLGDAVIYKADANTGTLSTPKTVVIDLAGDEDPWADWCSAIDYTKGVVLAVCYLADPEVTYIGTIDVTTYEYEALLTPLTTIPYVYGEGDGLDVPNLLFSAIAVNPVDGKIYGFTEYPYHAAWMISLDDEYPTWLADLEWWIPGADFDRSGQLWLTGTSSIRAAALVNSWLNLLTFDISTASVVPGPVLASEEVNDMGDPRSITVWGLLAATGATTSPTVPVIAAGILLLGAILAAGTMVLRRRATTE